MKAHNLVQYSDPVQHPHKKAIQSLVATSPQWCQQWLGTVNKDNHSHSVDDAHICCHSIKRVAMFLVF